MSCPFFRPKMFSPGDRVWYHSRTLNAHVLATAVGPLPNGPQFCHIRYIRPGGVTQVDHESAQLSRLEAVVVASPKSPASPDITPMASQPQTPAVCLHQWRVPQFALKCPCNLPPSRGETITWRPSLPLGEGDRYALWGEISRGGEGGVLGLEE